ncbi:MAG: S9 family peptidase [Planctomycetota bacterium]
MLIRLTCLLLLTAPLSRAADRITPEMLFDLGRVGAPVISPDGKWLVHAVTRYDLEEDRGNSDLWLLSLEDGKSRQLTTDPKSDSSPLFAPDGSSIAFLSSRSGQSQVHLIDPFGGEARAVTSVKEGVANFHWSPDGRSLSFTSAVKLDPELTEQYPDLKKANTRIIDSLLYRHWNVWSDGTYSHLFTMRLDDKAPHDLMGKEKVDTPLVPFGGAEQIAWSPDGQEICYTAKRVEHPEASTDSDLYLIPATGGEPKCITDGMDGFDRNPLYSPDGRWIAFHSMKRATFEADRERLMLYDRESEETRDLTDRVEHWVGDMVWTPDSSSLYFCSPVTGTEQIFRVDLEGNVHQLTHGRHDLAGLAISPDGKSLFAQQSTMERPPELVRVSASNGEIEILTHVNDEIFKKLAMPTVRERWVKTADDRDMHCWVIYPPDFDPKRRYPLITYLQGGPQAPITQRFSYRWNFHLMAAREYIVIAPSRRGMPGFGQEWNDAISKDWGGRAMQDYLDATDSMFVEPYVDREHAAAIGASFGGYSVYWMMGHNQKHRFACMVAHAGLFNLESWSTSTGELWFANWDLGPPFWTGPEAQASFDRDSPHRFVAEWDTPLLVIHGEKDFRVPVAEAMQAFTAAQVKGVPSRFLYFPEEGHWVLGPQNGVLWHRVFFDWLDRFCK